MKLEYILRHLPVNIDAPALVSGILIEREQDLDSSRSENRIIILTDRVLTRNGGNGHSGVDGIDMENIRRAVRLALAEERKSGFIMSFVVRERRWYPAGAYNRI